MDRRRNDEARFEREYLRLLKHPESPELQKLLRKVGPARAIRALRTAKGDLDALEGLLRVGEAMRATATPTRVTTFLRLPRRERTRLVRWFWREIERRAALKEAASRGGASPGPPAPPSPRGARAIRARARGYSRLTSGSAQAAAALLDAWLKPERILELGSPDDAADRVLRGLRAAAGAA